MDSPAASAPMRFFVKYCGPFDGTIEFIDKNIRSWGKGCFVIDKVNVVPRRRSDSSWNSASMRVELVLSEWLLPSDHPYVSNLRLLYSNDPNEPVDIVCGPIEEEPREEPEFYPEEDEEEDDTENSFASIPTPYGLVTPAVARKMLASAKRDLSRITNKREYERERLNVEQLEHSLERYDQGSIF